MYLGVVEIVSGIEWDGGSTPFLCCWSCSSATAVSLSFLTSYHVLLHFSLLLFPSPGPPCRSLLPFPPPGPPHRLCFVRPQGHVAQPSPHRSLPDAEPTPEPTCLPSLPTPPSPSVPAKPVPPSSRPPSLRPPSPRPLSPCCAVAEA